MIQRFSFVKLMDDAVAERAAIATRLRAQLGAAGVRAVVGLPADDSAARWDVSLVIEVESLDAWRALAVRADVAAALAELASRATVVKAWTFEAA